jgi:NADPH:quinone reductase-like Zn-dependent oxidoreductase
MQLVGSGAIEIPVDATLPFEELPAALARLEAGAQLGKLVLTR